MRAEYTRAEYEELADEACARLLIEDDTTPATILSDCCHDAINELRTRRLVSDEQVIGAICTIALRILREDF